MPPAGRALSRGCGGSALALRPISTWSLVAGPSIANCFLRRRLRYFFFGAISKLPKRVHARHQRLVQRAQRRPWRRCRSRPAGRPAAGAASAACLANVHHGVGVAVAQAQALPSASCAVSAMLGQAAGGDQRAASGPGSGRCGSRCSSAGWPGRQRGRPSLFSCAIGAATLAARRVGVKRTASVECAASQTPREHRRWTPAPHRHRLRIQRVQDELAAVGGHALLVPSSDPHLSEYLPERWQGARLAVGLHRLDGHAGGHAGPRRAVRRQPLLGAGRGRTRRQRHRAGEDRHRQLDRACRLAGRSRCRAGGTVAVDGAGAGPGGGAGAARARCDAAGVTLRTDLDLLDDVWPDRPACRPRRSTNTCAPHATAAARRQAGARARGDGRRTAPAHHFVSTVDDIAWITNLRGSDVNYNPVFLAHLLIDPTRRHAVRRRRQDRRRAGRGAGRRRHRAGTLCRRPATRWPRWAPTTRCCSTRSASRWACASRSARRARGRGHQPEHAGQEPQDRRRSGPRARGDGRGRRRDVRVLRLVRGRAGARRSA